MDIQKKTTEGFIPHSRLESLYIFLDQLKQIQVQKTLDINYWQKRILTEVNPTEIATLESELKGYNEEAKDLTAQISVLRLMIEEEKKLLTTEELTKILEKVKIPSTKETVLKIIDTFILSIVPFEVNYRFWQDRLAEATSPEVKKQIIETQTTPYKQSIDLKTGGRKNAEAYLAALEQEELKEKGDNLTN